VESRERAKSAAERTGSPPLRRRETRPGGPYEKPYIDSEGLGNGSASELPAAAFVAAHRAVMRSDCRWRAATASAAADPPVGIAK
jgi:hypothetical protein